MNCDAQILYNHTYRESEDYYVFELNETEVTEISDGQVSGFDGDNDLNQMHRL